MSDSRSTGPGQDPSPTPDTAVDTAPAFAHASEAELARILDFYAVRWEYEPHVFPILWNTEGDVVESFAPDFYLPDLDLYLEMTTLRQKLVRKKNRKLRRLRELYPAIRIKLFYARDFRALMLKYGRFALAEELSGTSGQVAPARTYDELLAGRFGDRGRRAAGVEPRDRSRQSWPRSRPAPVAPARRRRRRRATTPRASPGLRRSRPTDEQRTGRPPRRHRRDPRVRGRTSRPRSRARASGSAPTTAAGLTLVSVLKGSLPFMADLMRAIDVPVRIDLMEVSARTAAPRPSRPGWSASSRTCRRASPARTSSSSRTSSTPASP